MASRFLDGFTATHKTIIIVAAIVTPGVVFGTTTFQAVSVIDANTGVNVLVDNGRKLYVYDPIAGLANNPANFVRITGTAAGDDVTNTIYTVPAGKALIVKSVGMSYYNGVAGADNFFYLNCADPVDHFIAGFDDLNALGAHNNQLGNGLYCHSGGTLTYLSYNYKNTLMNTIFTIEGYLVPSSAVPAAASLEAAQQSIHVGGPLKK